ncbi:MAG TPA: sugar-transfer associated ATP-grasp domain-containing protein [Candidatus Bathyarchaeia archaeon]|nr:sugar-transfer associated ATP-grasp domain-containing protein [Candidatus Bathyarchaeia archaeon]
MLVQPGQILGLNARSLQYLKPLNTKKGRQAADSKLLTKKYLRRAGLPNPKRLAVLKTPGEVMDFDWLSLPDNFVLKPVSGYAGGGIIIIKRKAKFAGEWRLMDDSIINISDLRLRSLDILAGQYSLHNLPDKAMIEERIKISKVFRKYAYQGTPDVRVVVYNKVPVMAMLRLPTAESKGKGNLHQGAIGVGIDIATGITTYGIVQGHFIKYIPGTKRKINGLKMPHWNTILTLAVKAQEAVPSLGFVGVDIVFDKQHGPVILELNARPGIEIQNANLAPLKRRLGRVEGLEIKDAEHGARVAKTLFAARFADRVMVEEGVKILNSIEEVKVRSQDKKKVPVPARIDTGAFRSSIDRQLAKELGLLTKKNILWRDKFAYRSAAGKQTRSVINLTIWLAGRKVQTSASIADRSKMKTLLMIGRNDLGGFIVRP